MQEFIVEIKRNRKGVSARMSVHEYEAIRSIINKASEANVVDIDEKVDRGFKIATNKLLAGVLPKVENLEETL